MVNAGIVCRGVTDDGLTIIGYGVDWQSIWEKYVKHWSYDRDTVASVFFEITGEQLPVECDVTTAGALAVHLNDGDVGQLVQCMVNEVVTEIDNAEGQELDVWWDDMDVEADDLDACQHYV